MQHINWLNVYLTIGLEADIPIRQAIGNTYQLELELELFDKIQKELLELGFLAVISIDTPVETEIRFHQKIPPNIGAAVYFSWKPKDRIINLIGLGQISLIDLKNKSCTISRVYQGKIIKVVCDNPISCINAFMIRLKEINFASF